MKYIIKLVLITLVIIGLHSCSNKDLYSIEDINANLSSFITSKTQYVNVDANKICVVRIGNDTLAITDESENVLVPKSLTPTVEYFDNATTRADYSTKLANKNLYWEVIAFEDTKNGDYDYNDLIIHVKYEIVNKKIFNMYICPIAYGAAKKIDLYYEIYHGSNNNPIAQGNFKNVKSSLFKSDYNGYINTTSYEKHYDGYTASLTNIPVTANSLSAISVVWYIMADGNDSPIYALNQQLLDKFDMLDSKGYPYSLVLSGVNEKGYTQVVSNKVISCGYDWFRYPLEQVDIRTCYNIQDWIKSSNKPLENYIISDKSIMNVDTKNNISGLRLYELSSPLQKVTSWEK